MTVLAWIAAGAGVVGCLLLRRASNAWRQQARHAAAELQQAQEALRRQDAELARLRATLGGLGEGLILLDRDQRVVDWNAAAAALADLPERPTRPQALADTLPWGQLQDAFARLEGENSKAEEFERIEDDGGDEPRSLLISVRSLGRHGYVVSIRDQSRLKRLESMRRDFVANVSHELKTPLTAIKGFVETMQDDIGMPESTRIRFLERISRQGDRLSSLVHDLLTLSHLDEAAGGAERFQPCDLAAVTKETVRDLASLADQKRIGLTVDGAAERLFVRAEREGLRQVVGNLVDNAIKYTPEGGKVAVRLEQTREHVRLQVADTGIGLTPEDQQRVFERFYRVDRARSRELGGTGLGLSIVKNTVRGFGGDVAVQSAVGRGTVFWVTLPRLPMEQVP